MSRSTSRQRHHALDDGRSHIGVDTERDFELTTLNNAQPRAWHADVRTVSLKVLKQVFGFNPFKTSYFTLFRPLQGLEARLTLGAGIVLAVAAGTPLPIIGVIFSKIINDFPPAESELTLRLGELLGVGGAYFVVTAGYSIAWGLTGERISRRLREALVNRLLGLDQAYFDIEDPDVTNLLTDKIETIQIGTSEKVGIFIQSISYFVAAFVVGFILNAKLTGILFAAVIPLMTIIVVCGSFGISRYAKKASDYAELASKVAEGAIASVKVVQAFDMSGKLSEDHYKLLCTSSGYAMRKSAAAAVMLGAVYFTAYAANGLAFYEGSRMAAEAGSGGAGTVYAVVFLILDASFVVGQFGPFLGAFGTAAAAGEQIFNVLDHARPAIDVYGSDGAPVNNQTFHEDIQFDAATFVYPSRDSTRALNSLDLTLKAGGMNAIVGASGCGKSTLVSLLLRLYDVTAGKLTIGGVDIKDFNINSLRSHISLVDQDSVIFSGSILDNIRHGLTSSEMTEHEVNVRCTEAARDANLDFLHKLPNGINTCIGQGGFTQLSGGQKQRICLARALVKKPSLLLLDEPTSALDSTSEMLVMKAVKRVATSGCTVVMVAHRLATVMDSENIILMASGKVLEQGSHYDLIAQKGAYTAMVHAQGLGDNDFSELDALDEQVSAECFSTSSSTKSDKSAETVMSSQRSVDDQQQLGTWRMLLRCLRLAQKDSPLLFLGLVASVVSGGIILGEAIVFGNLIQLLNTDAHSNGFLGRAYFFCLLFLILAIVALFSYCISGTAFGVVSAHFIAKVQQISLINILRQDMEWFSGCTVQSLMTSLQSEASQLSCLSGVALGTIFTVCTSVFGGIILAHVVAWKIAIVLLSAVPVMVGSGYIRLRVLALGESRHRSAYNDAASIAAESCRSIRTVAALGRERAVYLAYKDALKEPYKSGLKFTLISNTLLALSLSITYFVYALAYWWGAQQVRNGDYDQLQFFIVLPALLFSAQSAGQVFSISPEISRANGAAHKVFALHDVRPTIMSDDNANGKQHHSSSSVSTSSSTDLGHDAKCRQLGRIELKDVGLSYVSKSNFPALEGVTLSIAPGEFVALVGPSGAGKSSFVSLIERFYDPTSGRITLDGKDIRNVPVTQHRARLGLVPQDPDLFPGSILYNIRLGAALKQQVTDDEVQAICKKCGIHDFIMSLPEAYNTECGTNGSKLSGGQKQRVAIARALIRSPEVLLLDEYTSALDAHSEQQIKEAVKSAAKGRTTIVVAHRLSTVQHADRIFVFDHGKLVETGNHDELVGLGGVYASMVKAQTLM